MDYLAQTLDPAASKGISSVRVGGISFADCTLFGLLILDCRTLRNGNSSIRLRWSSLGRSVLNGSALRNGYGVGHSLLYGCHRLAVGSITHGLAVYNHSFALRRRGAGLRRATSGRSCLGSRRPYFIFLHLTFLVLGIERSPSSTSMRGHPWHR